MVPPIETVITPENVKNLTEAELAIANKEYESRIAANLAAKELEAKIGVDYKFLLNKPNMTAKDKANMEKSIKFLIDKKMDTSENIKKLEAIIYYGNYIEIG